jgi:hypothetical protein
MLTKANEKSKPVNVITPVLASSFLGMPAITGMRRMSEKFAQSAAASVSGV